MFQASVEVNQWEQLRRIGPKSASIFGKPDAQIQGLREPV